MRKVKYSGILGKPSSNAILLVVALETFRKSEEEQARAYQLAVEEHHVGLLFKLLEHYKIELGNSGRWFQLAYKLAQDHVPAFQFSDKHPGAPRKRGQIRDLMSIGRKPGRQKTRSDKLLKGVLFKVRSECEKHGFSGHGAIKRALESYICEYAKRNDLSANRLLARELADLQKLVSEAKRKFPKIAAKLPR
jgi:hypothetical protein